MKKTKNTYIPINFSTPMIQAILEGRKTQTRRLIKPQPTKQREVEQGEKYLSGATEEGVTSKDMTNVDINIDDLLEENPIKKGVILWVREKWEYSDDLEEPYLYEQKYNSDYLEEYHNLIKWKSSTHMPKEAARTFLKVTDVRLERLQDITEEEAMQEGVERFYEGYGGPSAGFLYNDYNHGRQFHLPSARKGFQSLWQSIYGFKSWDENPWVWVYSFEWIDKPKDWKY